MQPTHQVLVIYIVLHWVYIDFKAELQELFVIHTYKATDSEVEPALQSSRGPGGREGTL